MSELTVRALTEHATDVTLGRTLVHEYVVATHAEMQGPGYEPVDLDTLLGIMPDLADFEDRYLTDGAAFLVAETPGAAEADGRVAGGTGVTPYDRGTAELHRLWVRPDHRRRGAARRLTEEAIAVSRALGYRRLALDVLPARTRAIALYRSLGFVDGEPLHDYPFAVVELVRSL